MYLKERVALTIQICNKMCMNHLLKSAARTVLAASLVLSGAALAQAKDIKPADSALFGDYLAGTYARYLEDPKSRADYYASAFARLDGDTELGRKAIASAINAGDMEFAKTLAQKVHAKDKEEPLAALVLGVDAFAKGRYKKANRYFLPEKETGVSSIMIDMIKGWNYAGQNQPQKAAAIFDNLSQRGYFSALANLQKAKLWSEDGDVEKAREAFTLVEDGEQSAIETKLSKARFLASIGDKPGALKDLQEFSDINGEFETGPVRQYIDALEAGDDIGAALSAEQQAARALTDPWRFFVNSRSRDTGEMFLRLALVLDSDYSQAKIALAYYLENTDRGDEAAALYQSIAKDDPYYVSSRLGEANIYFGEENDGKALEILEAVYAERPLFITREALGRARLIGEDYAAALPIYDAIVKNMSEEDIKKDTQPLYFRGICYEREEQWNLAEADFKKVLEIEPDNADALNYLGYTWVDRGEHLKEAFDMIRKAIDLEPNSGAIVDSLGWAHYKLGEYEQARVKLEDATALSPSSATIIDHLGDVYWKLGRFREAGYQWNRALEFDPTDKERLTIAAKLKGGLEAAKTVQ